MGLFSKKSFVGLDLGSHSLKAVQVDRAGTIWRVAKTGFAPTPKDCIRGGVVTDPETLGEAIKQLLRDAGISATTAHIAAAGAAVFVRVVPFPKMPEAVLRKSIRYEATRYLPGSTEDSYIELQILGPISDTQMNVLMVAAPRDNVESRIRACQLAGLEVDSVDIEMFSAYRSLLETDPEFEGAGKTLALVDVGSTSTTVSVVEDGLFAMTRSVPSGGQAFTDELTRKFSLSAVDAESGKSQLDARDLLSETGPEAAPPLQALQPLFEELIREVKRSMNYYQTQQDGGDIKQIDRVVLFGGGAKLAGLPEYFESRLGMPVEAMGIYSNPRILPPTSGCETGYDLAVATGLALRATGKG
jgi:type IV pilus assembly protein PilM